MWSCQGRGKKEDQREHHIHGCDQGGECWCDRARDGEDLPRCPLKKASERIHAHIPGKAPYTRTKMQSFIEKK